MGRNQRFTCIIPFYNEGMRILPVLRVATSVPLISRVLCVDDGSTDGTSAHVRKHYPSVTLLRLEKNTGKAAAVARGLAEVRTRNVLLLDADVQQLNRREVERALLAFACPLPPSLPHGRADMIILQNPGALKWIESLLRTDVLISGNRVARLRDLKEAVRAHPSGYQLESAINLHMMKRKKRAYWMRCTSRNPYKAQKRGFLKGIAADIRMFADILAYLGPFAFLKQVIFFCREELR